MAADTPNALKGHRPRIGRLVLFVAVSLGVLITTLGVAYAVDTSTRNRLVPIQWEGVENSRAAGMTVRLERDGFAYMENFPEGQESEQTYNDRQYICFEQAAAENTFTGAASWEWVGEWGIQLRFGTSSVVCMRKNPDTSSRTQTGHIRGLTRAEKR